LFACLLSCLLPRFTHPEFSRASHSEPAIRTSQSFREEPAIQSEPSRARVTVSHSQSHSGSSSHPGPAIQGQSERSHPEPSRATARATARVSQTMVDSEPSRAIQGHSEPFRVNQSHSLRRWR
jgi:hypothetical protein